MSIEFELIRRNAFRKGIIEMSIFRSYVAYLQRGAKTDFERTSAAKLNKQQNLLWENAMSNNYQLSLFDTQLISFELLSGTLEDLIVRRIKLNDNEAGLLPLICCRNQA
jgi:hypothetical protein